VEISKFLKIKCNGCGHEIIGYSNTTTIICCAKCGNLMLRPTGGDSEIVNCDVVDVYG